jgi:myo-inositol 2-dehydrogenase / D-chiro-inositol 1-dehydrogenase
MRIALLGCGRIGRMYAEQLGTREGVRVLLHDVDPDRAEALAAAGLGEVAEAPDAGTDAAVVTASTDSHLALVTALLERGVPTLCEKPLTLDLAGTEQVGRAAEAGRIPLWVGFQRHFDPDFAAVRDFIAGGELGRLSVLRLCSHDARCPPVSRLAASGSIFRDLMLHDFDLVTWLSGSAVTEVTAYGAVVAVPELAALGDFDTVTAMLRLAGGGLAVLTAGRHQPLGYDVRLEALGSAAAVTVGLDDRTPLRSLATGAAPDRSPDQPGATGPAPYRDYRDRFEAAYRSQLDGFLAAAAGGPVDRRAGSWRDSHAALRVAIAAEESVRTGRSVPVPARPE